MTEDIFKTFFKKYATPKAMLLMSRISVLIVAILSFVLSLNPKDSILGLVGNAWAGFGAAFGPLIILSLVWKKTTVKGALLGMIVGGLTVLLWIYLPHSYKEVYEIIPGFILSMLTIIIVSLIDKPVSEEVSKEFEEMESILKKER